MNIRRIPTIPTPVSPQIGLEVGRVIIESSTDLLLRWRDIQSSLDRRGFVVIEGWDASRETLKTILPFFGRIQGHEFAEADGIVEIRHGHQNRNARFGYRETDFLPHTDGAPLGAPPAYVVLQTVIPSLQGGESLLVDTLPIIERLRAVEPELFRACANPQAMCSSWPTLESPSHGLFELRPNGKWRVRMNSGRSLHPNFENAVREVIDEHLHHPANAQQFLLREKQILVVDNFRMLHGRTAIPATGETARLHRRSWIWDETATVGITVPNAYRPISSPALILETARTLSAGSHVL